MITADCGCWFVFVVTLFCWSDLLIVAVQGWITECCFQWYHTGIGIETLRSFWLLLLWNGKHSLRVSLPSRQPTSGFCYYFWAVLKEIVVCPNQLTLLCRCWIGSMNFVFITHPCLSEEFECSGFCRCMMANTDLCICLRKTFTPMLTVWKVFSTSVSLMLITFPSWWTLTVIWWLAQLLVYQSA